MADLPLDPELPLLKRMNISAALQDSLLLIFNRIEAAEKGNEKLDSNKKVLQKYIEDLTGMHQTTALDSHEKY
ncbi:hypothetical protein FOBRF1_007443 [Fusarium oxysporum]